MFSRKQKGGNNNLDDDNHNDAESLPCAYYRERQREADQIWEAWASQADCKRAATVSRWKSKTTYFPSKALRLLILHHCTDSWKLFFDRCVQNIINHLPANLQNSITVFFKQWITTWFLVPQPWKLHCFLGCNKVAASGLCECVISFIGCELPGSSVAYQKLACDPPVVHNPKRHI